MSDVFQKSADLDEPRGRLDPAAFRARARFETWAPPADLIAIVEHGWCVSWQGVTTPFRNEEVMHRPYVDLFVDEHSAGVQGTFRQRRTYVAEGTGRVIGVRFRPGGFAACWSGTMADLENGMHALDRFLSPAAVAEVAGVRRFDAGLAVERLFGIVRGMEPQPDDRIEHVNAIIAMVEADRNLVTVGDVAARFGRSDRWLQQLFREITGVNLKWLLRRVRLLGIARAIRETDEPAWADLAYAFGYASQQHFNTEFKHEIGQTPRQYWHQTHPAGSDR